MAYVERNEGSIVGVYAKPQPGLAEEQLADDNAEVVAFLSAPAAAAQEAETRADEIVAAPGFADIDTNLKTMTPAEWDAYLTANMTTLEEARAIVYQLGLILMAMRT